jgi:hypothetical protein
MESNAHVNAPSTPNKVLQQVSPIPQIPKAIYSRRKQTATVLTEADFIKQKKIKASSRNHKAKTTGSRKKPAKHRIFSKERDVSLLSSDDDSFLPCKSGESEFSDENECMECLERIRKLNLQQTGFGALYASGSYMKHAQYIHKCVLFGEDGKREKKEGGQ